MHQFDICALRRPAGLVTHVVVLQHDQLGDLASVLVAPLQAQMVSETRPRLHPRVEIGGSILWLMVERLAAIERRQLGPVVGSAAEHGDAIKRAIDLAFFGN